MNSNATAQMVTVSQGGKPRKPKPGLRDYHDVPFPEGTQPKPRNHEDTLKAIRLIAWDGMSSQRRNYKESLELIAAICTNKLDE